MERTTPVRLVLLLVLASCRLRAAESTVNEYQVKALFLVNFSKFVQWPSEAFTSADEPVSVCVLGENPFGSALAEAVRGQSSGNRPLVIRQIDAVRSSTRCHVLYLARSEPRQARNSLAAVTAHPVFTVGESDDFIAAGGILRFVIRNARVRFEIGSVAASRANLRISSQLLNLADQVR